MNSSVVSREVGVVCARAPEAALRLVVTMSVDWVYGEEGRGLKDPGVES